MCSPEYYAVYNTKNVEQAPRVEISSSLSERRRGPPVSNGKLWV